MVHDFLHHCAALSTFISFWCFSLYILHVLLSLSQQVCNVNDTVCHLPGPLFNVYAVGDFNSICK